MGESSGEYSRAWRLLSGFARRPSRWFWGMDFTNPNLQSGYEGTDFTTDQYHGLTVANVVSSSFSLLGSSFIVLSMLFLAHKSKQQNDNYGMLRELHFRLVFLLSCSDIAYCLAMLIGDPEDGSTLCYVQAASSSFFNLCSLGWVIAISATLWGTFVRNWPRGDRDFERRMLCRYAVGICFGASVLTSLPFIGDNYGDAGALCWIKDTDTGQLLRYATFYFWLWLGFVTICVMYFQILKALVVLIEANPSVSFKAAANDSCCGRHCRMLTILFCGDSQGIYDENFEPTRRVMQRVCLYPVVMVMSYLFASINRVQNSADPAHPLITLFYLHITAANSSGFFNAIVYGFNKSLQNDLRRHCCAGAVSDSSPEDPTASMHSDDAANWRTIVPNPVVSPTSGLTDAPTGVGLVNNDLLMSLALDHRTHQTEITGLVTHTSPEKLLDYRSFP